MKLTLHKIGPIRVEALAFPCRTEGICIRCKKTEQTISQKQLYNSTFFQIRLLNNKDKFIIGIEKRRGKRGSSVPCHR